MKKLKRSNILIASGMICLVLSGALKLINENESRESSSSARKIVEEMEKSIDSPDKNLNLPVSKWDNEGVEIDGVGYYALLEIPKLDVKLPVSNNYSYEQMRYSLCLYKGNIREKNAVICGHNFSGFLQRLGDLSGGDKVYLTDSKGMTLEYVVDNVFLLGGNQMNELLKDEKEWDLTIFTCDYSGMQRYTVRCVLSEL